MKRALTALLSPALAAFALLSSARLPAPTLPVQKKAQAPAAAQAAGLQLAEFCGSPGNPCRIFGYVHTDANYQGVRSRLVTLDRGDCDGSGYTFTFGWGILAGARHQSAGPRLTRVQRCGRDDHVRGCGRDVPVQGLHRQRRQ